MRYLFFSEDEEDELRKVFGGSSESETEEEPKTELESPTDVTVAAREESKTIVKTKEAKPRVQKLSKEIKKEDKDDLKISLPGSDLESSEFKSDKESLSQTQFVKKPLPPPPPKPQFKRRSAKAEEEAVMEFVERGALDKEEVHMLKLAMARMRAEEEELLEDMIWAHFPHNILSFFSISQGFIWGGGGGGGAFTHPWKLCVPLGDFRPLICP